MPKIAVKCDIDGCHKRRYITVEGVAVLRVEGERENARAGLICPQCVEKAMDNPDEFAFDMTIGEMVIQAARNDGPWRVLYTPR